MTSRCRDQSVTMLCLASRSACGRSSAKMRPSSTESSIRTKRDVSSRTQPYKLEIIQAILSGTLDPDGNEADHGDSVPSTYRHGAFEDLCRGPHVNRASEIDPAALKVTRIAGAYWLGTGRDQHVVILHRAPLGSHERFVGFLIEHFAGAFPVWLSPVQARLIPVADRHVEFARKISKTLNDLDFRVDVDNANECMQNKIRRAQLEKIPFMLIVGDREAAAEHVSIRLRSGENLGPTPVTQFIERLGWLVRNRSLALHPA